MGLFVINEDKDIKVLSNLNDDDLYDKSSKIDLSKEEGLHKFVNMGLENLLKIENTMTHTTEFNPNEVYLKKKEANEYGAEIIKYIGKMSNPTFLERLQHRIENYITKLKLKTINNTFMVKYGDEAIGKKIIRAIKIVRDLLLEVLSKILRAIVAALARIHRFIKDKYNNYKYRKEIKKYDKDSLNTAVGYNKNAKIFGSKYRDIGNDIKNNSLGLS